MDDSVRQDIENEILSGSWQAIRHRLSSNTAKRLFRATDLNDDGYNFFHILCAKNDAPPDIIEKMIDTDKEYLTAKSDVDENALHFSAETGSISTIRFLLDRMCKVKPWDNEDQFWLNEHGLTPLDILWKSRLDPVYQMWNGESNSAQSAIELIKRMDNIECYGNMTAEMQDLWGKTNYFVHAALTGSTQGHTLPSGEQWFIIHELVKHGGRNEFYFPREVLWFAAKLYPSLVRMRNEDGDLPLHIALKNPLQSSWSVIQNMATIDRYDQSDEKLPSIFDDFTGRTAVSVLLREFPEAAVMKDGSGRMPLQIVCDDLLYKNLELEVNDVDALLKAAPAASLSADNDGNTPLHVLCKFFFQPNHTCVRTEQVAGHALLNIVKLTPEAAGVRNQSGRFPMNILLHKGGPVRKVFSPKVKDFRAMVEILADATPDVLDVPDDGTRLLPFMMAAIGEHASIDTTYTLLRRNPANVAGGITRTAYEQYLEQKVNELSSEVKSLKDGFDPNPSVKRRKLGM